MDLRLRSQRLRKPEQWPKPVGRTWRSRWPYPCRRGVLKPCLSVAATIWMEFGKCDHGQVADACGRFSHDSSSGSGVWDDVVAAYAVALAMMSLMSRQQAGFVTFGLRNPMERRDLLRDKRVSKRSTLHRLLLSGYPPLAPAVTGGDSPVARGQMPMKAALACERGSEWWHCPVLFWSFLLFLNVPWPSVQMYLLMLNRKDRVSDSVEGHENC